jgi:hypothetical protein
VTDSIKAILGSPGAVGQIMHLEPEGGYCVLNYVWLVHFKFDLNVAIASTFGVFF